MTDCFATESQIQSGSSVVTVDHLHECARVGRVAGHVVVVGLFGPRVVRDPSIDRITALDGHADPEVGAQGEPVQPVPTQRSRKAAKVVPHQLPGTNVGLVYSGGGKQSCTSSTPAGLSIVRANARHSKDEPYAWKGSVIATSKVSAKLGPLHLLADVLEPQPARLTFGCVLQDHSRVRSSHVDRPQRRIARSGRGDDRQSSEARVTQQLVRHGAQPDRRHGANLQQVPEVTAASVG